MGAKQAGEPIELEEKLDRAERVIATGREMLAAYEAIAQAPPAVTNTATASVTNGNTLAAAFGFVAVCILASMAWTSKRDREAADMVRQAQVEAISAKWKADSDIRDARSQVAATERAAELRILAAERRSDMAELTTLRAQVQSTGDDIKGLRAYDARFASELATIKAATNGK